MRLGIADGCVRLIRSMRCGILFPMTAALLYRDVALHQVHARWIDEHGAAVSVMISMMQYAWMIFTRRFSEWYKNVSARVAVWRCSSVGRAADS